MTVIAEPAAAVLNADSIKSAYREAATLRNKVQQAQQGVEGFTVHPSYAQSAANLLGYLALRRNDIRALQRQLANLGVSSLGRCEANVMASVERVTEVLRQLTPGRRPQRSGSMVSAGDGEALLHAHTAALFGSDTPERGVRIMVTMPSEAATSYALVESLVKAGMDCQRINCAHDSPAAWLKMIKHARRAARAQGRPCSVMMDLAGPKLRTGQIDQAPEVIRLKPQRDDLGRVVTPAKVWLYAQARAASKAEQGIRVAGPWLGALKVGDEVRLRDARGSKRRMVIAAVGKTGCWAEVHKTTYVTQGQRLKLKRAKGRSANTPVLSVVGAKEKSIKLHEGDMLVLTQDIETGRPATLDTQGNVKTPATVGCTLGPAFQDIRAGEPIWFDDGKIGGVIEVVEADALHIRICHAPAGAKLKSDKGINLPDTELKLDALSPEDLQALQFACKHADVVQMSFVNTAADINDLIRHLQRLDALDIGVVLKIETRRGFENLAQLLLAGMQLPRLGVMIARGDLAIENGFERTAELQEQILHLCEAAHVPVIWATQVLETLAKTGSPSRAEITDAATGGRAECVMLNKGPHILKAIGTLDDVIGRMQGHRSKKVDLMRKLRLAEIGEWS
jgi:pyruvate kinase